MTVEYAHPNDFSTVQEPTLNADENRVQYDFDSLLGRRDRTYVFVDYLFEKRPSGLHGAVGTRMSPVHVDEAERQEERYRDYEDSPVRYLYEEIDPVQSWDQWIESQFQHEGLRIIYDNSYEYKYGEVVKDKAKKELGISEKDIAIVECTGGGRMFNEVKRDFDVVYDDELFRLVKQAEESGISGFY